MVKTLIDRADTIPSTDNRKQQEKDRVIQELKINDYPEKFISDACRRRVAPPPNDNKGTKGFTSIPHIRGISKQIQRNYPA